jgi:CheY-like chemotaxis protein
MINVKKVRELTKDLTVLYAEDELSAQREITKTLKIFFKRIIVASDGEEGLEHYYNYQDDIDLVMSDIQMPKINGLEMIEQIRAGDRDIPVIMLTAFNDQEYFIKSISLKIDKYLIKPLDQKAFIETIYDVANMLSQRHLLAKLIRENQKAELLAKEKETISKITEAYSLPMVIFKDGILIHSSNSFISMFGEVYDGDINKITPDTTGIFGIKHGYLSSFDSYDSVNYENNRVYLATKNGIKIFRLYKKHIDISDRSADMYMFIDITFEEHIKAKDNSYTQSLEKLVVQEKTTSLNQNQKIKARDISAKEYAVDVDPDSISKLLELDRVDSSFYEAISEFEEGTKTNLGIISKYLSQYADNIKPFDEFMDIYVVINNLAELLVNLDIGILSASEHSTFIKNLRTIRNELSNWRQSIFINQNDVSIHSHDAALFSACLQIETLFSDIDDEGIDEVSNFDFF